MRRRVGSLLDVVAFTGLLALFNFAVGLPFLGVLLIIIAAMSLLMHIFY